LGIVIVHYNTPKLLRACLGQLESDPPRLPCDVVVVDNASAADPVRELACAFPRVRFLRNDANLGFARASNQGLRATAAPYCLLLNPDALAAGPALDHLVEVLETTPRAGAVAPRLAGTDGRLQLSCRRFPKLRVLLARATRLDCLLPRLADAYLMRDWDHAQERVVDWAMGACLLLRRAALDQVGLLDEGFFMYYEDLDLCRRLGQAGWEVRYTPAVTVVHAHQRGSARLLPNRLAWIHLRSLARLVRKHRLAW